MIAGDPDAGVAAEAGPRSSTDAADYVRAILNILEDFSTEKTQLEATQKAILNILEDFDGEKSKVEAANEGLLHEIVERRQAEQALVDKTNELGRSNADLEQFAYVASHDLQEPLRMVSSYVQLFEKRYRGQVDEQADKYIQYAVEGARRMSLLIGGLLEYSRVGRDETTPVIVSTEQALERAMFNLRVVIEESGAAVSHDPLPEVVADAGQLAQVFQNLLGNAMKFRAPGVAPRVHVTAARRGDDWLFGVEDNGIGIAPQHAERVFVIFQRLHERTQYPGTGIGLAICKKVVERHGGRIWVESEPGRGATFRFTLPAPGSPP